MSRKTKVALVKGADPKTSVNEAVNLLGGIGKYVRKGSSVVVKPNLCMPVTRETGQATHPDVIRAVVELCKEAEASRIVIGDTPMVGFSGREVIRTTGMEEVAKQEGVETLDFHEDVWVDVKIPNGIGTKRVRFPQIILSCDAFINVPKMKCHGMTMVTLALKNLQGIVHGKDKFELTHGAPDYEARPRVGGPPFPRNGLEYAMVDLHRVVRPTLNIVDGIIGPDIPSWGGRPGFKPELVVAGEDAVAVDAVSTKAMGLDPATVNMIQIASEAGIGTANIDEIEVVGTTLDEVNAGYTVPSTFSGPIKAQEYREPNLHLIAGEACNVCLSGVRTPLGRVTATTKEKLQPTDFEEMTVVVGKNALIPGDYSGKLVLYGNCAARQYGGVHPFENSVTCPGCPPAGGSLWWLWKRRRIDALKNVQ